ncbi:MAG TPA: FmdB family transcriptional regulator [Planctomycetaceae bacterium]|jgi:putative FmdB family regulatory protein|nr:FmdB family transcriptional regulator [Planctomycetaceae bacterium]
MPTYEYQCGACEHKWEEFQSISAKPTKKCPECGRAKAERLISAGGGIIFRGSGFYQTDYRSDSYRKGAEAAKKASDGGSSGGGSGGSGSGSTKSADSGSKSSKSGGGD